MNNIFEIRNKLIKKRNVINLLLFPCWMMSFFISIDAIIKVLPIVEFITIMLNMEYLNRHMLLSFVEFFYKYLPTMIYIGGKVYLFNINKEIRKLDNDFKLVIEKEMLNMKKKQCVVFDEEEVRRVYNIVERFAKLPRSKQMEVLNYI